MNSQSQAKIISYNYDNTAICAAAARISTTEGDSEAVLEKSKNNASNEKLIKKVLGSGHRSTIEHAVFTLSLRNVSAYAEQFFIEFRLASFTVKSRRYVDFSRQGYYIPKDLREDELKFYKEYMDMLFSAYGQLLENDIPREDARFLLPYSFNSNFYCTLNARELINLICAIKYGRGREIPELNELAEQIIEQIKEIFPCIADEISNPKQDSFNGGSAAVGLSGYETREPVFYTENQVGTVKTVNYPANPNEVLKAAAKVSGIVSAPSELPLLERPRILEQLNYSFLISNVTLSGVTHLVRHRMQSIIVPPIQSIDFNKHIIPESVLRSEKAAQIYRGAAAKAGDMINSALKNDRLEKYIYYFALSGNVMDVMTTMNARELLLFIKLRTCSRAQWEVRNIAVQMLGDLRGHFPELFGKYGPSCFVCGVCPEGERTCGKMREVKEKFYAGNKIK